MKTLRTFILVSLIFLAGAVTATAVVWYLVVLAPQSSTRSSDNVPNETTKEETSTSFDVEATTDHTASVGEETQTPIVINIAHLTDAQKTMARTLGFTDDEIVVNVAAQVCAEEAIGSVRLDEIIAGATPTLGEGIALFNCLKK